jgi:hydroxyacylglutathione hydrolase
VAGAVIVPVVDEGLGNSAYLADLGDGRALAVDVPRDLRAVRAAAGRRGLRVAFAADTHLYADFLSGALPLAADDDAHILASAAGDRAYGHRGLADGDEDAFVTALLAGLGTFPGYFLRLPEQNRRGPAILASMPALASLTPRQIRARQNDGGQVIDVRPVPAYAAGHIPGSLAIPLRDAFATWLGRLVPDPATPLVIVAGPGQDLGEAVWQALKIGYENLAGTLAGGLPAWEAAGQPVTATALLTPGQVDPAAVIDVRQASEYAGGHLPGARNIELGALTSQAARVGSGPIVTMCGHGERAATAASVLERAGHTGVAVLPGGPPEWADATGLALERGG